MRLIDADKLHYSRIRIAHSDGTIGGYNAVVMSAEIKDAPTVDAVPWMWLEVFAKAKPFDSVEAFITEAKGMSCKMYSCCCADGERRTK